MAAPFGGFKQSGFGKDLGKCDHLIRQDLISVLHCLVEKNGLKRYSLFFYNLSEPQWKSLDLNFRQTISLLSLCVTCCSVVRLSASFNISICVDQNDIISKSFVTVSIIVFITKKLNSHVFYSFFSFAGKEALNEYLKTKVITVEY